MLNHNDLAPIARDVVSRLGRVGVNGRLFGGVAIEMVAPWRTIFGSDRPQKDLDLVIAFSDLPVALEELRAAGWLIDRRSVMLNGARGVHAALAETRVRMDVFTDPLRFNQTIVIGERLRFPGITLSATDLLLTKLQVVNATDRDVRDMAAMLAILPLSPASGHGQVDVSRIEQACSMSWGFHHGACLNLCRVGDLLAGDEKLPLGPRTQATEAARRLERAIEGSAKGVGWKIRAWLGPRLPWYDHVD